MFSLVRRVCVHRVRPGEALMPEVIKLSVVGGLIWRLKSADLVVILSSKAWLSGFQAWARALESAQEWLLLGRWPGEVGEA